MLIQLHISIWNKWWITAIQYWFHVLKLIQLHTTYSFWNLSGFIIRSQQSCIWYIDHTRKLKLHYDIYPIVTTELRLVHWPHKAAGTPWPRQLHVTQALPFLLPGPRAEGSTESTPHLCTALSGCHLSVEVVRTYTMNEYLGKSHTFNAYFRFLNLREESQKSTKGEINLLAFIFMLLKFLLKLSINSPFVLSWSRNLTSTSHFTENKESFKLVLLSSSLMWRMF